MWVGQKHLTNSNYTTSDYNKFTCDIFDAKINKNKKVKKYNVFHLIKNSDLNTKLAALATKAVLKFKQGKLLKLKMHDLS